ncbi:protease [Archangium violaceum]|uniref:M57 family metalloprotease n=1 Tax=Archangium violaceum TaxID=83451 RepID=UPI001951709A|nr:M57 family metalloprotease [Archangium violaceum]QRN94453.1 protease [Archangium violaceum]
MFRNAGVLVLSALMAACQRGPTAEQKEILSILIQAGFPENDIQFYDGDVYVGRDGHVTLEAARELRFDSDPNVGCGLPSNMVGKSVTRICVNPSASFNSYSRLSQGLDAAINNYNELGLRITFARGPTSGCTANIWADTMSGTGGSAGFPSGGRPYGAIKIGVGLQNYSEDVNERVITHELGHTIGRRHSDYFDRTITCGSGGDVGAGTKGAILITGSPSTAIVGGSVMNSCVSSTETGEWTGSDRTALNYLY